MSEFTREEIEGMIPVAKDYPQLDLFANGMRGLCMAYLETRGKRSLDTFEAQVFCNAIIKSARPDQVEKMQRILAMLSEG